MKFGRWLIMAVLASFTAVLLVSSVAGQGLKGANSAVIFDYEVTNDGGILFADEFDRLGGVDTLGYPASYRFELDGFTYQVTQRALLQWRSNIGVAYLGNIFEMLEHAGLDQWLLESKGIPLPIKDDGSNGDWNKARETRLSWLTNEQIKAKFLANPNPDAISDWNEDSAINLYGLPMSMPERHGPFISQRFQRVAFQLWVDEVAGSPAPGTVIGVLAGDLLKEAGLVPPEGLNVAERPVVVVAPAPAPAPAPSSSQPRATAKPRATAVATAVATPPAANLMLSSLSLGDVGLSPAFDADTTGYTANAANEVESVKVTAEAASEDATVEIAPDDADADADGHQVALAEGADTTITIKVTVGDDTATYTVTVTRAAAPLAEGAVLNSLSLSDVTLLPAFSSETLKYTASVVHGIASTTVKVTKPTAARLGPAAASSEAGHPVNLEVGPNTIDIAVTAGDVTTFYQIVITRGAAAADASLSTLSLDTTGVTLDPEFSRHTYRYTVTVPNSVDDVTVTAAGNTTEAPDIVYRVGSGRGIILSNADIPLTEGGITTIKVEVTSDDGDNTQTYTIVITRLASAGPKDTTLAALSLADIELDFTPSNRNYTAEVEYADAETTVAWTVNANEAVAQVIVNGQTSGSEGPTGTATATLAVGENFILVRVTSPDDLAVQDYEVRVIRAAFVASDDATLSGIQFSPALTLKPAFNKDVTSYTAGVAASLLSVEVTPSVTDAADEDQDGPDGVATFVVKPSDDNTTPYTVGLKEGNTVITIEVTAEDGTTKKVYSITVTREGTSGADDATLQSLTLTDTTDDTGGTANHKPVDLGVFDRMTTSYTATVSFATTEVTIFGQLNIVASGYVSRIDRNDDGDVDDADEVINNNVLELTEAGEYEIVVRVTTAGTPAASKDYTITLTRLARVDSSDATLSALTATVAGDVVELAPEFHPNTGPYKVTVDKEIEAVEVAATVKDTDEATFVITPEDSDDTNDGHQVDLDEGANTITIVVTAEDGTTKTYTVTVTRTPRSADSSLSALTLKVGEDDVTLRPTFDSAKILYNADVDADVASVTLTATAAAGGELADVEVRVRGGEITGNNEGEYVVPTLSLSTTYTIKVKVTAENTEHSTVYEIALTKAGS